MLRAVANANGEIGEALPERRFTELADLDHVLIELGGTPTKARLGANAIVVAPVPGFNIVNAGVPQPGRFAANSMPSPYRLHLVSTSERDGEGVS